ncbi:alpha-1,6-mannosyl-glycoprotein 2-beta-N-acetylglucosaminyltransferase-like isoform X1 [Tenebrio molitor]|uniref:alpha-1,6-mannosyl-glycoprotein 2-beta-N-acetylglucosaminyltransferase-like isoform X1 n=1 Tax=Tenebrio molitor TaxID=7067 RepID=UPI0036247F99
MRHFLKKMNPRLATTVMLAWGCLVVIVFLKNSHTEYPQSSAPMLSQVTLNDLRNFIHLMNIKQLVYNTHKKVSVDLVIVVQVHDRLPHLQQLIRSLSLASGINNTLLIFSHDVYQPYINSAIHNITFAKTMQIFYPLSVQMYPDEFPGPSLQDYLDDDWRNATVTQLKHHWWWTSNFVFNRVRILHDYSGPVLFLEDDNYLTPDFIHCLFLMRDHASTCPSCRFLVLGTAKQGHLIPSDYNAVIVKSNLENYGVALNRSTWHEVSKYGEFFCKFDDYRWVASLTHAVRQLISSDPTTMALALPRVARTTSCGSLSTRKSCRLVKSFRQFPTFFTTKTVEVESADVSHGGWTNSRDQILCMGM